MTFGPLFPATRRKNVRESSFELIRLIAQLMIVTYHIYLIAIIPTFDGVFNRAVCIPLHIGVPLFVLISGYWGIHLSGKGLAKLLAQMLVYTAILLLIYDYLTNTGGKIYYQHIYDSFTFPTLVHANIHYSLPFFACHQ